MRRPGLALAIVLAAGSLARLGYVLAQPAADPAFARPTLDGALYWAWAGRIAAGEAGPTGAFYLAPLYPYLLGLARAIAGEAFAAVYLVQHAAIVAAAWLLSRVAAVSAGPLAAGATALLLLTYHPLLFFSSRPLSEPLAILLASAALALLPSPASRSSVSAGALAALCALARPNLLLLIPGWAALLWRRGRGRAALLMVVAAAAVVAPVTIRNLVVSGHLVPISSNAGITLFHGNAPGANGGYTATAGQSGSPLTQRAEAIAFARLQTGQPLDAVEADRWWGRRAVRARLADPAGTLRLGLRRAALTVADAELGLDAALALDENPWRHAAPVPFALILGLAAAGFVARGLDGSGGRQTWVAIAACAVAPLAFYVSSRYRLPLAALLTVPAGCGVAALLGGASGATRRVRTLPIAAGLIAIGLSLSIPTATLERTQRAAALANRVSQRLAAGDTGGALRDADASLALEPTSVAHVNRGLVLIEAGRPAEAERDWRSALALEPTSAAAAGNLSAQLIRHERAGEAIPMLRAALAAHPADEVCWTNLVVAHASIGDRDGARRAADEARRRDVLLDAGLLGAIDGSVP